MNFDLDEDEQAVVGSVRALLRGRYDAGQRADARTAFDQRLWSELAFSLGMLPMVLPEDVGGDGGGPVLGGLVVRELGAVLYDGPYLSSLLGVAALVGVGDEWARELLRATAEGAARPTLAPWSGAGLVAVPHGDHVSLTGTARGVLDAESATHLVVEAATPAGERLHVLVATDSPGLVTSTVDSFDLSRSTGVIVLDGVVARPLVGDPGHTADLTRALLASEQVGGARAVLDQGVVYARTREQFGRPIGSFQAIKHQCADVLVAVELAEVTVDHVLCLLEAGRPVGELAATALAMASDAYVRAALVALHVHGGIGFTWESGLHLHLRRAKATAALLGSPADQRDLVLARLGL